MLNDFFMATGTGETLKNKNKKIMSKQRKSKQMYI